MTRTTKLELTQINARLAAENAALRAQLSERTVTEQLNRAPKGEPSALSEQEPECDVREHVYDTPAAAMTRCKELVAWDTARRYMFVVRGNRVICKIRHTQH